LGWQMSRESGVSIDDERRRKKNDKGKTTAVLLHLLAGTGGRGEMGIFCTRAVHHPQRVLQPFDSFYRHKD
jgi:hypothetical protein